MGTHMYTGGKSDIIINFGVSSFNFTTGEFGYLFKKGNTFMETLSYSIGLFTNLSDSWAYIKTSYLSDDILQLQTDGHSQIHNPNDGKTFSWGAMRPDGTRYVDSQTPFFQRLKFLFKKLNSVTDYENSTGNSKLFRKINISNINLKSYDDYIQNVNSKGISYRMGVLFPVKSMHCTIAASRALLSAGVFNLPILRMPWLLDFQMRLREHMYLSYSLKGF